MIETGIVLIGIIVGIVLIMICVWGKD